MIIMIVIMMKVIQRSRKNKTKFNNFTKYNFKFL
jgi:hypothetical protein